MLAVLVVGPLVVCAVAASELAAAGHPVLAGLVGAPPILAAFAAVALLFREALT